ncbi:ribosomal-processing cysteine protease Prp [Numidum massiliense]|uniref:ribosomal-processing cysteine protease Prp n=1 Tax=Numidum massiliense TaxID=1522315 RepID=UPI0006D59E1F|nr:ribosomal-processing cysteine protease Prp [Numidum massiliense]
MINITVKRDKVAQTVREVTLSGHAGYDDYGKDIVCAAVSSVYINIVNAVEALLHVSLTLEQQGGHAVCRVPDLKDEQVAARVQLLLETLVFSLQTIAKEYPSFVSIRDSGKE